MDPGADGEAVDDDDDGAEDGADDCDCFDELGGFVFEVCFFWCDGLECCADFADFGGGAGGCDVFEAVSLDDEGAGVDGGEVVAAGWLGWCVAVPFAFADGDGFAGEEAFVDGEVLAEEEVSVGGDSVAFSEYDDVVFYYFSAGYAVLLSVADNEGAWAAEVAECVECSFGFALLVEGDADDDDDEEEEHDAVLGFAEEEVDESCDEQEEEHGFEEDVEEDDEDVALSLGGEFVVAFGLESVLCLGLAEALDVFE